MDVKNLVLQVKEKGVDETSKKFNKLGKEVSNTTNNINKSNTFLKENRGALMGIGFAALFGGMALKRVFSSALTSLFQNYKDVMDETSAFNQATNQLSGAWTFFKFTLVDALMQTGLFESIIGFVIKMINVISNLTSQNKLVSKFVMFFLVFGLILSGVLMILGQVGLAFQSMAMLGVKAGMPMLLTFAAIITTILIVMGVVVMLSRIWDSEMDNMSKILLTLGVVFLGLAGIALAFGFTSAAVILGLVGAFLLLLAGIYIFRDELKIIFTETIPNYFKLWGLKATSWVLNTIIDLRIKWNEFFRWFAEKSDKYLGTNFSQGFEDKISKLKKEKDDLNDIIFDEEQNMLAQIEVSNAKLKSAFNSTIDEIKSVFSPEKTTDTMKPFKTEDYVDTNLDNYFDKEKYATNETNNLLSELVSNQKEGNNTLKDIDNKDFKTTVLNDVKLMGNELNLTSSTE